MAALRRSRHLCSFILFAGILAAPVVPASAQVLAFGPMQNYQPGFPQYAPQTAPQSAAFDDPEPMDDRVYPAARETAKFPNSDPPNGTAMSFRLAKTSDSGH